MSMNQSSLYSRTDCRLCGSVNLKEAIPMLPTPIGDDYLTQENIYKNQELYPLNLHLCMDCSHLQGLHVINPQLLFSNYIYSTSTSPGLVAHFNVYADEILKRFNFEKGS